MERRIDWTLIVDITSILYKLEEDKLIDISTEEAAVLLCCIHDDIIKTRDIKSSVIEAYRQLEWDDPSEEVIHRFTNSIDLISFD